MRGSFFNKGHTLPCFKFLSVLKKVCLSGMWLRKKYKSESWCLVNSSFRKQSKFSCLVRWSLNDVRASWTAGTGAFSLKPVHLRFQGLVFWEKTLPNFVFIFFLLKRKLHPHNTRVYSWRRCQWTSQSHMQKCEWGWAQAPLLPGQPSVVFIGFSKPCETQECKTQAWKKLINLLIVVL